MDNHIEREIYIEKISKEYEISKEAIYAKINKLTYSNNKDKKILEQPRKMVKNNIEEKQVSETIKKRENTILALILTGDINIFQIIKQNIKPEEFKYELNKKIAIKLYEEFEKGNSNINSIIDKLEEEEQNHITAIMAEDFEFEDYEKAIDDILQIYEKEKLNERKLEILSLLDKTAEIDEKKKLEKELSNIIIRLAKIK